MSKGKVNLEKILAKWVSKNLQEQGRSKEASDLVDKTSIEGGSYWYILEAMKEACRQTLELAAENAKIEDVNFDCHILDEYKHAPEIFEINKQSILDTIKQIE